jgi:hypothetical protein
MYTNEQLNAIHYSKIGIEFEFFSNFDLKKTKEELSNLFGKKIKIKEKTHSDFSPTYDTWKMEPDNSGGSGMIELVTGSLPYAETKIVIAKMLKWIKENGSTNDKCSIHINISFDGEKLGTAANISKLDIGKFVLNFDEDAVYNAFPNRKDSVYAKSIKFIVPLSGMTQPSTANTLWKNYMFVKEKYYGVNFSKIPKNYIEFRYLGGKDYELKYDTIMKMVNHFIVSLYDAIINPTYTSEDKEKLKKVLKQHEDVVKSYKSYNNFKKYFSDIKILVDLKTADQIVQMFYPKIREKIFDLLTKADMRSGLINYDSDLGRIQIKDTELLKCFEIQGVDIVDSKVQGNIIECDLFNCEISNSLITKSNVFGSSEIKESKLKNCYVNKNVACYNSYVFGKIGVFSGEMNGGIFRQGRVTKFARFTNNAEIIEMEKI